MKHSLTFYAVRFLVRFILCGVVIYGGMVALAYLEGAFK